MTDSIVLVVGVVWRRRTTISVVGAAHEKMENGLPMSTDLDVVVLMEMASPGFREFNPQGRSSLLVYEIRVPSATLKTSRRMMRSMSNPCFWDSGILCFAIRSKGGWTSILAQDKG